MSLFGKVKLDRSSKPFKLKQLKVMKSNFTTAKIKMGKLQKQGNSLVAQGQCQPVCMQNYTNTL